MKILVVEDNFVARNILHNQLAALGEVDSAGNGREALEAVKMALEEHAPYGLICLDVTMPELSGIGALQGIRRLEIQGGVKEQNRAKILMTTGHSDRKKVLASAKAGCDAYMIKPITRLRLFEELSKLGIVETA
jgi:two-component system chemotaxis response regulator CheY